MYLEISGFDEYADVPTPENQRKIKQFASTIVDSQQGIAPVRVVNIVGHADRALRLSPEQRQQKEMEVSVNRASKAATFLLEEMRRLPDGTEFANSVQIMQSGVGSRHRKVLNPTTESEMRKNRRVEITTAANEFEVIHVLPEWPPVDLIVTNPELPKVFSIKIMEGVTAGAGVGVCVYTVVVWDKKEARAGVFVYMAAMTGGGVGSPFTGESDWGDVLVGPNVRVEDFDGWASHATGSAIFTVMVLNTSKGSAVLPIGFGLAVGYQAGQGRFQLDGPVKIFHGD